MYGETDALFKPKCMGHFFAFPVIDKTHGTFDPLHKTHGVPLTSRWLGQALINEMHAFFAHLSKTHGVALTGARAARYLQEVPLGPPSPFWSRIEGLGMVFVMVRGRPVKPEKNALGISQ